MNVERISDNSFHLIIIDEAHDMSIWTLNIKGSVIFILGNRVDTCKRLYHIHLDNSKLVFNSSFKYWPFSCQDSPMAHALAFTVSVDGQVSAWFLSDHAEAPVPYIVFETAPLDSQNIISASPNGTIAIGIHNLTL